ncbi:hypothetical protein GCM10022397_14910 [Flavivirga jejuensis]
MFIEILTKYSNSKSENIVLKNLKEIFYEIVSHDSWVYELIFSLIFLGALYSLGLIISSSSIYLTKSLKLIEWLKSRKIIINLYQKIGINNKQDEISTNLGSLMLKLAKKIDIKPLVYSEMVKRYTRVIMLRNLAFVTLLLLIIGVIINYSRAKLLIESLIFIFIYISFRNRHKWFNAQLNYFLKNESVKTND